MNQAYWTKRVHQCIMPSLEADIGAGSTAYCPECKTVWYFDGYHFSKKKPVDNQQEVD